MNSFKQSVLSLCAIAVAGLMLNWTYNTFLETPQFQTGAMREKYDAWLNESTLHAATSRALLEERMRSMDNTMDVSATRGEVIDSLREYSGSYTLYTTATQPISADGARFVMMPTADEAETRISRGFERTNYATVTEVGLQGRNARLILEQQQTLSELEEDAVLQSEMIRGILNQTSISMASIIGGAARVNDDQLVSEEFLVYLNDTGVEPQFVARVSEVMARITEARRLQSVMRATPLSNPLLVDYRLTSGFGWRIDPFTLLPRAHFGLDFVAYSRAPVVATSPGVVSFAGVKRGYGNCVYIDHGYGFTTRYAHLAQINVQPGQRVALSETIGLMGSTGRSTGTHLHYEIWYRGRALDPNRFLQAGATIYGS